MEKTRRNAVILKKLSEGQTISARWVEILPEDLRAAAIATLQVDVGMRSTRLRAELIALGEVDLLEDVGRADPEVDPDSLAPSGYDFQTLGDSYKDLSPLQWVIKGLFARPSVNIIFGAPKGLKTMLLLEAAVCVAGAKKWLTDPDGHGGFEVQTCPTAWLDFENGERRMVERISAFGRGRDLTDAVPFFGRQCRTRGSTPPTSSGWSG